MRALIAALALALPTDAFAQSRNLSAEHLFIKEIMLELQPMSFAENREMCGYIGYDADGVLRTTDVVPGTEASCALPPLDAKLTIVASYHTHSTYSPDYNSEYPSLQDLRSDVASQLNGYIVTPGGRVWFHDYRKGEVIQVCQLECVPQDPNFRVAPGDPTLTLYTRAMLEKLQ